MEWQRTPLEESRIVGMRWLVTLRWFAGMGVFGLGLGLRLLFGPGQNVAPLLLMGCFILLYNTLFRWPLARLDMKTAILLQIILDWVALAGLCHFTMGLHSPFLAFFIFHSVLSSVFSSRRTSWLHSCIAIFLVTAMTALEQTNLLPAFNLSVLTHERLLPPDPLPFVILALGCLYALILLTTFLTTTVVARLRQGEEQQLKLRHDLNSAYGELIVRGEAKDRFVRMVSHELRSPLSAIQSLVRVVIDGYGGVVDARAQEILLRAEKRVLRLVGMVNELLDLMRGAQPVPPEVIQEIHIRECITKIIQEMGTMAAAREIHLDFQYDDDDLTILGDVQDLERIFINLIGNAIKYTPNGGHVRIHCLRTPDHQCRVEVSDTGIGIPCEELPHLFEEFYRAANAKALKLEGTGLGLAIVKRTVEKYNGNMTVESRLGSGSTFTVHLPLST